MKYKHKIYEITILHQIERLVFLLRLLSQKLYRPIKFEIGAVTCGWEIGVITCIVKLI